MLLGLFLLLPLPELGKLYCPSWQARAGIAGEGMG